MNDQDIRRSFHKLKLRRYHEDPDSLVVDELGLHHGACRADIAVVNGSLLGYEIKSDADRLSRLPAQVSAYNTVFDRIGIIAGKRHISEVRRLVPTWWGITLCRLDVRGGIHFTTERRSCANPQVDLLSVAKLLWRSEAVQILRGMGVKPKGLSGPRRILYGRLVESLSSDDLRRTVRLILRSRTDWRCHARPSRCGGLSRPTAK